jgi:hypothetical protein
MEGRDLAVATNVKKNGTLRCVETFVRTGNVEVWDESRKVHINLRK